MIKQLVRSPKAWLAAFVLLDVLHRLIQLAAGPFPLIGDSLGYWRLGCALVSGEGLLVVDPEVTRTPIYPLFLAVFRGVFGAYGLQAAIIAQNLLAMSATLAVALAGARITARPWTGPLTYLVALACTGRVQYDQMILTESLSGSLLVFHGIAIVFGVAHSSRAWWGIAGLTGALLVLTRPSMALLPLAEALLLLTLVRSQSRRWLGLALVVGLPACGMAVWMLRNHETTGRWMVVGLSSTADWEHTFQRRGAALPLPEQVGRVIPASTDMRNGWAVADALNELGYSTANRDAWMAQVAGEAKTRWPLMYWARVAGAVAALYVSDEEVVSFELRDGSTMKQSAPGQTTICLARIVNHVQPVLARVYILSPWLLGGFAVSAACSCFLLVKWGGASRILGHWVIVTMLYVSIVTAIKMFPLYRYHVPLHLLMAMAIACALSCAWGRARSAQSTVGRN